VLETPEGALFETGAILLWLADRHGALAPAADAPGRGAFLKWLFFLSNTVHADMRTLFYPEKYIGADAAAQAALHGFHRQRLAQHLRILEQAAANDSLTDGSLTGGAPTVLDFYLACLLRWLALYPAARSRDWFALQNYPKLQAICAALQSRASVRAAQAAEGLGPNPFTAPEYANPPEGSAT
jgi:glutathione S-transferase